MGFFETANFDASKVAPHTPFTPLPDGTYRCHVKTASEEKTQDGTGLMLKLELGVLEPASLKGRSVFHRITLKNKNKTAVDIGQAQLSALCRATGIITPKSAGQFAGKIVKAKIAVEKRKDTGELANRVKDIILPEEAAGAASAAAPETAPAEEFNPFG
jgi:hypothetical protein